MNFFEKGQTLIELLLAMSLTAVLLPVLIVSFTSSREGRAQESQRLGAVQLLKEGQEAVRSVRERSWAEVATNGTFHPEVSSGTWILAGNEEDINGYVRKIDISDVYRDMNGAIIGIGGTLDPSTKRIVITVSWENPSSTQLQSTFFISRYENDVFTETTETEFDEGTLDGTVITNTDGGEVILGSGGHGNWCVPTLVTPGTDLTGQGEATSVVAFEGKAYSGTGNNSSGLSLTGTFISNNNPPTATQEGTFNGYKTNAIHAEGSHAYIATDTNQKEVVIVRLSPLPYAEVGYFDSDGGTSGRSVFVSGNTGYMIAGNKLYNFDLTSKTGSRPELDGDGVTLSGNGSQVVVNGNFAYVSIEGNSSREMEIVNVSNPTNLTISGFANINGQSARDLYINSSATRAYMATQEDSGRRELFIIDISTKTGSRPTVGSYDTSGMDPRGITLTPGNRAIIVGWNQEEYQIVDITNEASPTRCGGLQVPSGINGVASVLESDGDAYSYIVTQDANAEFRIIEGGPGGAYSDDGIFTSDFFDPGSEVVYNRFIPNVSLPPTTAVQFQIAVADPVSGSCASAGYTFLGPNGTTTDYFSTTGGPIYIDNNVSGYENPGRCFKYRAFLTTGDFASTPIINSVSVNYSL